MKNLVSSQSERKAIAKKVFTTAWQLFKLGFFQSFRASLMAAYRIVRIHIGKPTKISYAKADTGEIRDALALKTGSLDTIEKGFIRYVEQIGDLFEWRSFKIANLVIQ